MGLGYDELGIRPVINACATLTRLGGSRMPREVVDAMAGAARCFVDLHDLQEKVGQRIATLTRNEAAYVCSGAAAGLTLATAACVAGSDPDAIRRLPDIVGSKDQVIIHRGQRNGYDQAVRLAGVEIVDIGDRGRTTTRADLEAAITPRTAAFFWFQGAMTGPEDLPLPDVIDVMRPRGIPVVVDAAAQLPPVRHLWSFTMMGADVAIFSGGKDLRGPQSTGLLLGRREMIRACAVNGSPYHTIGRPMKVGKEEMVGILCAVERYVALDHDARARHCERVVAEWNAALNELPGVRAVRDFPNEAGQPLAWSLVTIEPGGAGTTCGEVVARLESGDPIVVVARAGTHALHLNPMTLEPGEERIVLDRLLEALAYR